MPDPAARPVEEVFNLLNGSTLIARAVGGDERKVQHYHAGLGRFMSRDPIGEAGGPNLYAFVGNNPLNWWDRLGNSFADGFITGYDDPSNPKNNPSPTPPQPDPTPPQQPAPSLFKSQKKVLLADVGLTCADTQTVELEHHKMTSFNLSAEMAVRIGGEYNAVVAKISGELGITVGAEHQTQWTQKQKSSIEMSGKGIPEGKKRLLVCLPDCENI